VLRLPTFWCAPNFAYLMAYDARQQVLSLPGVRTVRVVLKDHMYSDEITAGVSAGESFGEVFAGQCEGDDLEGLRQLFRGKAFGMRQEQLVRALLDGGLTAGEIVGLTGLIGSGYDEVPYLLYGATRASAGVLEIEGERHELPATSPAAAIRAGCVLVPGDRQNAAVIGTLPVLDNLSLPVIETVTSRWAVRGSRLAANAARLAERFDVRPRDPALPVGALSGGNQQKVVLAKWLQLKPRLILLDEPTQGVDVGAREQVFDAVRQAAREGACVLCASSDFEQLEAICDRVVVFSRGRAVSELAGPEVTKSAIAERCYEGGADSARRETVP
jgi:ABC-type sugar transport system ATPase subunit